MPTAAPLRWIIDRPANGPVNMARDEAVLLAVSSGQAPPTLRFYAWSPPTISLGYFQPFSDFAALGPPAGNLAVVRRLTGGGAILHDVELTYSLTLPLDHPIVPACGPGGLYDVVHDAFAGLLAQAGIHVARGPAGSGSAAHRGPFFCFERHSRYDLILAGRKLMGSAQRRTRTAVLQHGSLILNSRFDQQPCACLARHTDVDVSTWTRAVAERIAPGALTDASRYTDNELESADHLRSKYEDAAWTRKR